MEHTRRTFIRHAFLAGSGMALAGTALGFNSSRSKSCIPMIGLCTTVGTSKLVENSGGAYIEEYVREFLIPDRSEDEFNIKLALAKQSKLPVLACNSFFSREMKSVGPNTVHDTMLAFAETAFRRAKLAGIKLIVLGSGASRAIPEGFPREKAQEQFISLCKRMSPLAEKHGITIVLEPLNTHVCNFINTVAEGGELVETVNHPNFKLLADIYHMRVDNETPDNIVKYGSLIRHVHIAEIQDYSAPGNHGDDFTAYFDALKKIRYKGAISVECTWKNLEKEAPVAIRVIREQWER